MRITLLANQDLASNIALNLIIRRAPQHHYHILLSNRVGAATTLPAQLQALSFVEQTLFNQVIFPMAGSIQPSTENCLLSFDALKRLGTPVHQVKNINDQQGYQLVAAHKPNLLVSVRFGQILKQRVIDIAEFGVLNLHSGKLPDYRGVMATFWAMLEQQPSITATLHYIDSPDIDAGKIVSSYQHPVDYSQSYLTNLLALYPGGVNCILNAISALEQGRELPAEPMNIRHGHYYTYPDQQALDQFMAQGAKLFDYADIPAICDHYYRTPFLSNG